MATKPRKERPLSSEQLTDVLGALSHPSRRSILATLSARGGVMTAGEIADRYRQAWPTTTRHLGVLEKAGLVEVSKRGRHRLYAMRPDPIRRASERLAELGAPLPEDAMRPDWADLSYASMRNAIPAPE